MKNMKFTALLLLALMFASVNVGISQECLADSVAKPSSEAKVINLECIKVVPDTNWAKRKTGSEHDKLIQFYNEKGKLLKQIVKHNTDYISFPPSSNNFVALYRRKPEKYGETKSKPYINIYNNNGEVQNKIEIKNSCISRVYISDKTNLVFFGPNTNYSHNTKYYITGLWQN